MVKRRNRKQEINPTPEWYLRGLLTANRSKEFLMHLALFVSKSWPTLIVFVGILAWRRLNAVPFGFMDWAASTILLFPLLMALWAVFMSNIESQASGLSVRGRWDEVLDLMPKYRKKFTKALGEPKAELGTTLWTARSLARLGKREEAYEHLKTIRTTKGLTEADYFVALLQVQGLNHEYETARDTAQELLEIDPERMEGWLVICELDAVYLKDPQAARIALNHTMTLDSWRNLGPMADYVTGVTMAAEGNHTEALEKLEEFRTWAKAFAARLPMSWTIWAIAGCVMIRSLKTLGQHTQAETLLGEMRSLLESGQYVEVLYHMDSFINRDAGISSSATA